MSGLKLINVEKTYKGGVEAVKGINCTIKDKEFMVLVGPSGCGKSTVLRMIAGLEDITSGELYIGNNKVNDIAASERGISMVFQNYALYPHMNAFANMAFGLKIKKVAKSEIKERVLVAAKILNIESLLDKKPGEMSGGQRQRIAIGRAIVRRPELFLFDEPLSNLDAKLRSKMRIELTKLHKRLDATMVYVTHDQVEAMTLGQRIIVMNDGKIMQISTPMNIFNDPHNKFVAGFIGMPQMNFIEGKITNEPYLEFRNENGVIFDLSKLLSKNLNDYVNKQVSLGIRADDISWERGERKNISIGKGKIIAIEVLGNYKLVHIELHNQEIIANFRSEIIAQIDVEINLYFNMDKAYFFDIESEKRIY